MKILDAIKNDDIENTKIFENNKKFQKFNIKKSWNFCKTLLTFEKK